MKATFRKSFARDVRKVRDRVILDRVRQVIEQVETVTTLQEVSDLKQLAGTANCFRIRVGDYRLGIVVEGETVEFVRCLPRRDLYRFFP
jgi:mRNA interferase RelE/StbE